MQSAVEVAPQNQRKPHCHALPRKITRCVLCGEGFEQHREDHRFCSKACRQAWWRPLRHQSITVTAEQLEAAFGEGAAERLRQVQLGRVG